MHILIRVFLLLLMFAFASPVQAQSSAETLTQTVIKKSQLLVRPRDASGNIIITSFWEDPVQWARDKQQSFMAL